MSQGKSPYPFQTDNNALVDCIRHLIPDGERMREIEVDSQSFHRGLC